MTIQESNQKYYTSNKQSQFERVNRRRKEIAQWFEDYKETLNCSRCPENHPACLDFHHINPTEKTCTIYFGIRSKGWSKVRVLLEIEKCIVLCSNCHRKEHASVA